MPEKKTIERARRDKRQGKAPTTQAGEFVREEFERVRAGKADVKNDKQAIAIGLSKARRAGVAIPKKGGAKKRSSAKKASSGSAKKRSSTPKRSTAKRSTAKRSTARRGATSSRPRAAGGRGSSSRRTRASA